MMMSILRKNLDSRLELRVRCCEIIDTVHHEKMSLLVKMLMFRIEALNLIMVGDVSGSSGK